VTDLDPTVRTELEAAAFRRLVEHLRARAGHANFQTTYQLYVHPSPTTCAARGRKPSSI
jgi:hypothetical protein